jgi:hypothetical protein
MFSREYCKHLEIFFQFAGPQLMYFMYTCDWHREVYNFSISDVQNLKDICSETAVPTQELTCAAVSSG